MLRKIQFHLIVCLFMLTATSSAFADVYDLLYCGEYSAQYREMEYWARVSISITDYEYGSGDAKALKLVTGTDLKVKTNKEITDHFMKEYERLVKGRIPYHDVTAGTENRIAEFHRKNPNSGSDLYERFKAYDEARIRSLYGNKPAALYCNIRISRAEFPVLYEIETNVVASEDLINVNSGTLFHQNIGYSAPPYISGELKKKITEHLTKVNEKLKRIQSCK